MARSTSTAITDIVLSDGSVILPIMNGEQQHIQLQLNWLISLAGYEIKALVTEAVNTGAIPTQKKAGGVSRALTAANGCILSVDGDNIFTLVLPYDIAAGMTPAPTVDKPIYAFFEVTVGEPGTDTPTPPPSLQLWKPLHGLIKIQQGA